MKDMKNMVEAAPGMIEQAQQLGAQAQQVAMVQQMGQFAGLPGTALIGPDFDLIAGVSLAEFAAVCKGAAVSKGVAVCNYDQAKLPDIAASRGIAAASWDEANRGWNARIQANPLVAQRFSQLYRES